MNPTVKVAKRYPKVKFEHATGYKRAANLATYNIRYYEAALPDRRRRRPPVQDQHHRLYRRLPDP